MEKEKLEDYREKVRKIYAQLSDASRDSLPADLARPFSIGQEVIARHPSSRELCHGKVVIMGRAIYKVQFTNPDLGNDIVKVCSHCFSCFQCLLQYTDNSAICHIKYSFF
jgi:hypothetical protein